MPVLLRKLQIDYFRKTRRCGSVPAGGNQHKAKTSKNSLLYCGTIEMVVVELIHEINNH